jgi:hypothetical protein
MSEQLSAANRYAISVFAAGTVALAGGCGVTQEGSVAALDGPEVAVLYGATDASQLGAVGPRSRFRALCIEQDGQLRVAVMDDGQVTERGVVYTGSDTFKTVARPTPCRPTAR